MADDWVASVEDALDTVMTGVLSAVRQGMSVAAAAQDGIDDVLDVYEGLYKDVFVSFAEVRYESPTKQAPDNLIERWVQAALNFVASRPVERRIQRVLDSTIKWVNGIVADSLVEGFSTDRIADRIEAEWNDRENGNGSRARAERIARTETISAANAGSRQGVIDTGLDVRKFWISSFDSRVRRSHDTRLHPELEEPRPMNEPYTLDVMKGEVVVGTEQIMFPGSPDASAGNVIQCRCVEGYEVV